MQIAIAVVVSCIISYVVTNIKCKRVIMLTFAEEEKTRKILLNFLKEKIE